MSFVLRGLVLSLVAGAPLAAQIALPAYQRSYEAPAHARGFCFQAPVAFQVTGLQVPDEKGLGVQSVALYRLAQKPPAYYATLPATPIFAMQSQDSAEILEPPQPIAFAPGEWCAVLGTCGDETTQVSSYAANLHPSTVLGVPITLERLLLQDNLVTSRGVGGLSTNDQNPLGRVRIFIASGARADAFGVGSGPLPLATLRPDDVAPPRLGRFARLHVASTLPREPIGILLLGSGRDELVTPIGTILFGAPLLAAFVLPSTIPSTGLAVDVPLPDVPSLSGAVVGLQVFLYRDPDYALTNGLAWRLGL